MISEELLKQAAEETEQVMLDSLPTEETVHSFSPEFEQKCKVYATVQSSLRCITSACELPAQCWQCCFWAAW